MMLNCEIPESILVTKTEFIDLSLSLLNWLSLKLSVAEVTASWLTGCIESGTLSYDCYCRMPHVFAMLLMISHEMKL